MGNKRAYDINSMGSIFLREYAYSKGYEIYDFIDKYDIGANAYGQIMDQAHKGQGILAHRLCGHHLVYDFPIDQPQYWNQFLEHELSDLFTKQGLPILPDSILRDYGLIKYCDKLSGSWNFVNGFDILSGTVAIYKGADLFKKAFQNDISLQSFEDYASQLGIGTMELLIAFTSANPFLLVGAALHLTATIRGMLNDGSTVRFQLMQRASLGIEVHLDALSLKMRQQQLSIQTFQESMSIKNQQQGLNIRQL